MAQDCTSFHSSRDPEYFSSRRWNEADEARESSSAPESFSPPVAAFSGHLENERADSVYAESGVYSSAQRDGLSGCNHFDPDNPSRSLNDLPQSPILDSIHPWDEIPNQPFSASSVETTADLQENHTSRYRCEVCNKAFNHLSSLHRHVRTTHRQGRDYWICTVKGCRKKDKPVFRKDNFRRHCQTKHPLVDLAHFGL